MFVLEYFVFLICKRKIIYKKLIALFKACDLDKV